MKDILAPIGNGLSARASRGREGFTLIELLVAMAVLALMLALLLQVTNHTLQASRVTTQQMDATQTGRRVIDAFSSDMDHAILSKGGYLLVQSKNGAPSLVFLTEGRGPATTPTRFLAVNYRLENGQIVRAYNSADWPDQNLLVAAETAATNPSETSILAKGVLQFVVLALLEDGRTVVNLENGETMLPAPPPPPPGDPIPWEKSGTINGETIPAGWSALVLAAPPAAPTAPRVQALLIALVSVDEQNLSLLSSGDRTLFSQPKTTNPVKEWEEALAAGTFPGPARAAVRFSSKVIPLP